MARFRPSPGEEEEMSGLHLSGVTADGRLWHTIRRLDGSWFGFGDVEGQAGDRGTFRTVSVSSALNRSNENELHLSGVTADGRLWHTIRRSNGSWTQFGDVEGQAGERGNFVSVGIVGITRELHLAGVTDEGRLWHTIHRSDGSWTQFGDVEGQAGERGAFSAVSVSVALSPAGDIELHLSGVTADGRLWHTIRRPNGSWTQLGDVEGQAGDRGTFVSVGLAGVGNELHLAGVTDDGRLWHTIRRSSGSWTQFGDVEGQAGDRGTFVSVGLAGVGDELHLAGVTDDGRLWHTIRRSNGSWFGFGDVEGQAGDRGAFVTVGIAGVLQPIL
jgi:hypothetical protein